MGQKNLKRLQFKTEHSNITTAQNDTRQETPFTGYFQIGDTVDVVELDPMGNVLSTLSNNNTVASIEKDVALVLGSAVDTSVPPNGGVYYFWNQSIDDGQQAVDRLYHKTFDADDISCDVDLPITSQILNSPIAGQTKYEVNDLMELGVGDTVQILDVGLGGGLLGTALVVSVTVNADDVNNKSEVVIDQVIDTSLATSPVIHSIDITVEDCIDRLSSRIDSIDDPVENEYISNGDKKMCAFEASALFIAGSSKVLMDGNRKRLGTAGTRASLTQGAGDSQLIFTSMLLGLLGNEVRVRVQVGAGFTISVVSSFFASSSAILATTDYLITINDNGGLATSEEIADALNAHATVKRIIQVRWGGDGTGVVAVFGPTALTGGLDNGTADYAELEQIFENVISATGYKWVSFHIRPDERNRMNQPPEDDEEICIDYRKAMVNI